MHLAIKVNLAKWRKWQNVQLCGHIGCKHDVHLLLIRAELSNYGSQWRHQSNPRCMLQTERQPLCTALCLNCV